MEKRAELVERAVLLVIERSDWPGRGRRVTASTLVEVLGVDLSTARDLMWDAAQTGLVKVVMCRGTMTNAVLETV